MTDTQIMTIVIALLASVGGLFYNNSRVSDLRIDMNKSVDTLRSDLNKSMDTLRTDMNKRFDDVNRHIDDKSNLILERMQRMEDNIISRLADHETRIQRLERERKPE